MDNRSTNQQEAESNLSNIARVLGKAIHFGEYVYGEFLNLEVQLVPSVLSELRDLIDEEREQGHDVSALEDALRAVDSLEDNLGDLINTLYDGVLADLDDAQDQMHRVQRLLDADGAEVRHA